MMFLRRRFFRRAHPRVCGENFYHKHVKTLVDGSSPRVRGKQVVQALGGQAGGLIPACAGKTTRRPSPRTTPTAHPRVCGENSPPAIGTSQSAGSSPRVRGKRPRPHWRGTMRGLIPACAGKTATAQSGA